MSAMGRKRTFRRCKAPPDAQVAEQDVQIGGGRVTTLRAEAYCISVRPALIRSHATFRCDRLNACNG